MAKYAQTGGWWLLAGLLAASLAGCATQPRLKSNWTAVVAASPAILVQANEKRPLRGVVVEIGTGNDAATAVAEILQAEYPGSTWAPMPSCVLARRSSGVLAHSVMPRDGGTVEAMLELPVGGFVRPILDADPQLVPDCLVVVLVLAPSARNAPEHAMFARLEVVLQPLPDGELKGSALACYAQSVITTKISAVAAGVLAKHMLAELRRRAGS